MLILRDFDWNEFFERLGGPEGLNLRTENGRERWNCSNKSDYPHSRKILADMGVEESRMDAFLRAFQKARRVLRLRGHVERDVRDATA